MKWSLTEMTGLSAFHCDEQAGREEGKPFTTLVFSAFSGREMVKWYINYRLRCHGTIEIH